MDEFLALARDANAIIVLVSGIAALGAAMVAAVRKQTREQVGTKNSIDEIKKDMTTKLDSIKDLLESEHVGKPGLLARIARLEEDHRSLREWALDKGYERRRERQDDT